MGVKRQEQESTSSAEVGYTWVYTATSRRLQVVVQIQLCIMTVQIQKYGGGGGVTHSAVTSELQVLLSFCFTRQVQCGGLPSCCTRLVIRMTHYTVVVSGGGLVGVNHDVFAFWGPPVSSLRDSHRWTHWSQLVQGGVGEGWLRAETAMPGICVRPSAEASVRSVVYGRMTCMDVEGSDRYSIWWHCPDKRSEENHVKSVRTWSAGRELNAGPSKYEAGVPTTVSNLSVSCWDYFLYCGSGMWRTTSTRQICYLHLQGRRTRMHVFYPTHTAWICTIPCIAYFHSRLSTLTYLLWP
jgi:hypothetical protein